MPKSAPVPPPRRSIGSASGGGGASKMKLKNQQLKLLLENEFTIENFVNQSLVTQSEDDDDESDDEDVTGVKLSFSSSPHHSRPDLVPMSESYAASSDNSKETTKIELISPKIQTILDSLATPHTPPLNEYYQETLRKCSPSKRRLKMEHEISILNGPNNDEGQCQPRSLIESLVTGIGKVTTWRHQSGKIRQWSHAKLIGRCRAVAKQLQDTLQLGPGSTVGLCFPGGDLDGLASLIGCFLAGVNALPLVQPHLAPVGMKFQLKSLNVKYILTTASVVKSTTKKDEKDKWSGWTGVKVIKPAKSAPSNKWRWEPGRIDQGHLLIAKMCQESNDIVIVRVSQLALSHQLVALSSSLGLMPGEKVLSLESPSSSFTINGLLLPLYLGCDLFLLPAQVTKQAPEVWPRIVEKHNIQCLISRSREFSWATQTTSTTLCLSVKSLRHVLLLDGAQVSCLLYAQNASYQLAEKFELDANIVKSLIFIELGGTLGYVQLNDTSTEEHGSLRFSRGTLQLGTCVETVSQTSSSLNTVELPFYVTLLDHVQLVIGEEGAPVGRGTPGHVYAKAEWISHNEVLGLGEHVSRATFARQLDGLPGGWASTGLHGSVIQRGVKDEFVCLGTSDDVIPCACLTDAEDEEVMDLYRWDVMGTLLSVDQQLHIYHQRLHMFTVNIVHHPRLVLAIELKKDTSDEEIKLLTTDIVESLVQLHHVHPFAITLHHPHQLPTRPNWRLDCGQIKRDFETGQLQAHTVLTMPRACLDRALPRAIAPGCVVGAAGMVCGSVISGTELAYMTGVTATQPAPGQQQGTLAQRLSEMVTTQNELASKMNHEPLVTLKTTSQHVKLSPSELHKTATRLSLLLEKNHVAHGDLVLVYYDCPVKILAALYGCWYRGAVPIPVQSGADGRDRVNCVVSSIQVQFVLASGKKQLPGLSKTIRIIEAEHPHKMDSNSFQSLSRMPYQPPTNELRCMVDCFVTPVGGLIARQYSWKNVLSISQALKDQLEVYPGREIDIALDYTYGSGLFIMAVLGVYTGCHVSLHNVNDIEGRPSDFVNNVLPTLRDIFVSASIARNISRLKLGQVNNTKFKSTRSFNVVYQNVAPNSSVITRLGTLLESCGLQSRALSICCTFQSSPLLTMRPGTAKSIKSAYVDLTALKSGRVKFSQKGSKYAAQVHEVGTLMPGAEVTIADVTNQGQCGIGRLGEVWLRCQWSCANYLCSYGGNPQLPLDELKRTNRAKLMVGNDKGEWCRTGMLGFLKRDTATDELGLFVIGNMIEHFGHRGFKFHPHFIEETVIRTHSSISNACCIQVQGEIVVLIETTMISSKLLTLFAHITQQLADYHHLVGSVMVALEPRSIPMSKQGNPQRQRAAEMLLQEKFTTILISYNS